MTAYDTENGLVLSQKATPTKKGEIATVKEMLDILNLKGAVVTLDALHCQRETLEKSGTRTRISWCKLKITSANYERQYNLSFRPSSTQEKKAVVELKEEGHGRKEERYVFQLKAKLPEELVEKWPTIRSIIAVERHRVVNGKGTVDTSYYVSSLSPKHKLLGHYIRQHWRIESVPQAINLQHKDVCKLCSISSRKDGGRPTEVCCRKLASNHLKLLR